MITFLMTLQDSAPVKPWFDGNLMGGLVGGIGGALLGCLGAAAGYLAPRGKARGFILTAFLCFGALGVAAALAGVAAMLAHQPYAVWYSLLLVGFLFGVLGFALRPAIRKRYREAEQRRMQAADLRA